MITAARYVMRQLQFLASFTLTPDTLRAFRQAPVEFISKAELSAIRGAKIALVHDLEAPLIPENLWRVPFNKSQLTLWNPISCPGQDWLPVPSASHPIWWRHTSGALTPAWNLVANVYDLLTFREEREISVRDQHGRFPHIASPRHAAGLLQVPVVNEALAVLAGAVIGLQQGAGPLFDIAGLVKPPALILSHDCDILRGNDFYTQAVRAYRIFAPCAKLKLPRFELLPAIVSNAVLPKRYYLRNMFGMFDLERQFNFKSVSYILNGTGGRFGARSSIADAKELFASIPTGWEVGIHYNYDTHLDDHNFRQQIREIEEAGMPRVRFGRAHYLRFDPLQSLDFIAARGIKVDESIGWPSENSYRCGIAGPFRPLNQANDRELDLIEIPLVFMDANLMSSGAQSFREMFIHLSALGGILSVLTHPGSYFNPEFPERTGLYFRLLRQAYHAGSRSYLPSEIASSLATVRYAAAGA